MSLFNLPRRDSMTIDAVLSRMEIEEKSSFNVKGKSLLAQIENIKNVVKKNLAEVSRDYLLITTDDDWLDYCKKACQSEYTAYDTECDSLDTMQAHLVGICIKSTDLPSAYVSIGHKSAITDKLLPRQVSLKSITQGLKMLAESKTKFLMHHSYFDIVLTYQQTGIMLPVYFDTLVCGELLNENEPHGLKYLYAKYCKQSYNFHKFSDLFEGIPITYIPPDIAGIYGQFDAVMTYDLALWQMPFVTANTTECKQYNLEGVSQLFWNIDMPMIEVLVAMRIEGIKFDFDTARKLKIKYTQLKQEAELAFNNAVDYYKEDILAYIASHIGTQLEYPINFNSPVQLKILFYEIAKVPVGLYRKSPMGTGKEVINVIMNTSSLDNSPIKEIAKSLSDVKKYDKVIGTFIDTLTKDAKIHKGKIHCSFSLTSTDCIAPHTLIPTSKGYYTIEDIVNNRSDNVIIINKNCQYESTAQYVKFEDVPTVKVHMSYGYEIEGTYNHPIMNDKLEFIELQNIKVGDYIYLPLGYNLFPKEYVPLDKTIQRRLYKNSRKLWENTPSVINESVGLFLGMYHADGSINVSNGSYRVRIENFDDTAIEHIRQAFFDVFKVYPTEDKTYNAIWKKNRSGLFLAGVGISWLDKYIKTGVKNKKIPLAIKQSPRSVILSYIKGLTLDSSFYNNNELILTLADIEDVLFVQSVLVNIGIVSSIQKHKGSRHKKYRITVKGEDYNKFMQEIGACYDYPLLVPERHFSTGLYKKDNKTFIRVSKITYSKSDVYDFKVPETHSFISNSIVSHNTGRLSCSSPNLQQCPSGMGDIRNMFTAGEGNVFIGCDFSKQEPCMLASSCKDEDLIKTFTEGFDIYSKIASMIYPEYSYEECLEHYPDGSTNKEGKKRRGVAKKVVLSILYGKGRNTLCEDLGCKIEEVNRIFDNVFKAYPVMKKWMDNTVKKTYQQGYVDNIYGRRRRLPELNLPQYEIKFTPSLYTLSDETYYRQYYIKKIKETYGFNAKQSIINEAKTHGITIIDNESKIKAAERKIINFCIQGSAACVTKKAMLKLYHNKRLREMGCKLVLSIHDENVLICPKEHAYEAAKLIEELSIAGGEGLPVAMSCDLAISDVWYGEEYSFNNKHELIKKE